MKMVPGCFPIPSVLRGPYLIVWYKWVNPGAMSNGCLRDTEWTLSVQVSRG